jgi:hypothetical protein
VIENSCRYSRITAGANPYSVAVGDFNGDGNPDIAVANQNGNNVSVLLGNGDGTLQAPTYYLAGTIPVFLAVGDFNGTAAQTLWSPTKTATM